MVPISRLKGIEMQISGAVFKLRSVKVIPHGRNKVTHFRFLFDCRTPLIGDDPLFVSALPLVDFTHDAQALSVLPKGMEMQFSLAAVIHGEATFNVLNESALRKLKKPKAFLEECRRNKEDVKMSFAFEADYAPSNLRYNFRIPEEHNHNDYNADVHLTEMHQVRSFNLRLEQMLEQLICEVDTSLPLLLPE
ncbi:unnamed protein product [Amoebophrya sp. A120]|nr:unnamed protein product [Amoebophrya sp. A120]|eukprot:GSA120T00017130001.1